MFDHASLWHPLQWMTTAGLGWTMLACGFGSILFLLRLEGSARRLRTPAAPRGIGSLELSLSSFESRQMIDSWTNENRELARRHLCLDYWFIPVYTSALAMLGLLAARWFDQQGSTQLAWLATILAWGQWGAGLFDFTQNSTLLRILQTYPEIPAGLPAIAGWCARLRLLLITLATIAVVFVVTTRLP